MQQCYFFALVDKVCKVGIVKVYPIVNHINSDGGDLKRRLYNLKLIMEANVLYNTGGYKPNNISLLNNIKDCYV